MLNFKSNKLIVCPLGIDGLASLAWDNEHIYVTYQNRKSQNLHGELDGSVDRDGNVDGDGNVVDGGGGVYGDDVKVGPA